MATYQRPGVFLEETLQPLTDPALGDSDSVAAFVGASPKGGPVGPTLVGSWSHFQSLFGDIRSNRSDLAYGVYTYFNNGGSAAYVVRAVNADATPASLTVNDQQGTPAAAFTLTAKSPGSWASDAASKSRIFVSVTSPNGSGLDAGRFDLMVEVGSGLTMQAREQFIDLSLDPSDPNGRYALDIVNSPTAGSKYVSISSTVTAVNNTTDAGVPAAQNKTPLAGGTEGTGSPVLMDAVERLDTVDANLNVNLPGVSDPTVLTDVANWAAARNNVFVVVDPPKAAAADDAAEIAADLLTHAGGLPATSYVAVYGPWLYINDPGSAVAGAMREVAPGGSVLGQYAYTDTTRSVSKAPAGVGTSLKGVLETRARFTDAQLDSLNPAGVNVIRAVPGAGFCIMGARTLAIRTPDRYVNIRRSLMYIKRALVNVTRFAVFEPNNAALWEDIEAVVGQYLQELFQEGVLAGSNEAEAFFVKCDSEINTTDNVNAGVVKVEVGVALSSPAEFIIIRIGQFDSGEAAVEEETTEEIL